MLARRLKGYLAGRYLEAANPRLKDSPHRQLAAMVQEGEGRILEVFAATGFLSRIVAARFPGARISALDVSPDMVVQGRRRARRLGNLEFVHGDATAMPYPDASFDLVLAAFGLSGLPVDARSACLAEIRRVLTRPGRLLVADIDDSVRRPPLLGVRRGLLRRGAGDDVQGGALVRQIESRGFTVVRHVAGQGRQLPFQLIVAQRSCSAPDLLPSAAVESDRSGDRP